MVVIVQVFMYICSWKLSNWEGKPQAFMACTDPYKQIRIRKTDYVINSGKGERRQQSFYNYSCMILILALLIC